MKLFNKKYYMDGKPKEEDVPGELPALGEIGDSPSGAGAIPDELPNLDAPISSAKPQSAAPNGLTASQDLAVSPKAPAAEEEVAAPDLPESLPNLEKVQVAKPTVSQAKASSKALDESSKDFPSFFSSAGSLNSMGANGSLLSAMKKYWDKNRILDVPHQSNIINETEVAIQAEVEKLKELERAWLAKMKDFNILKQNIAYLEAEISTHSDELAALLSAGKSQKSARQKPKRKNQEKPKAKNSSKKR